MSEYCPYKIPLCLHIFRGPRGHSLQLREHNGTLCSYHFIFGFDGPFSCISTWSPPLYSKQILFCSQWVNYKYFVCFYGVELNNYKSMLSKWYFKFFRCFIFLFSNLVIKTTLSSSIFFFYFWMVFWLFLGNLVRNIKNKFT